MTQVHECVQLYPPAADANAARRATRHTHRAPRERRARQVIAAQAAEGRVRVERARISKMRVRACASPSARRRRACSRSPRRRPRWTDVEQHAQQRARTQARAAAAAARPAATTLASFPALLWLSREDLGAMSRNLYLARTCTVSQFAWKRDKKNSQMAPVQLYKSAKTISDVPVQIVTCQKLSM